MIIRPHERSSLPSTLFQRLRASSSRSASHVQKKAYTFISSIRDKIQDFLDSRDVPLIPGIRANRPSLLEPRLAPDASYGPARFFTRGAIDHDKKRNPDPISYLMEESQETSIPRPIPRNRTLLRTLTMGKGILRNNARGLVYLDVDNNFISSLIPFLRSQGLVRPPYFNLFGGTPDGAHIPVITAREAFFHDIQEIPEIGKEYTFEIESLCSMEPAIWPEVEEVWFFQVQAFELESIRRRNFLSSRPGGHPFHIAIAVKARTQSALRPVPPTLFRINPAFIAA